MPDLNDHMDDLFRKAGEHYPLRTEPDREDAMWSKLRGEKEPGKSIFGFNPLRKREIFLFLLGLFAGSFFLFYFLIANDSEQPVPENKTTSVNTSSLLQENALPPEKAVASDEVATQGNKEAARVNTITEKVELTTPVLQDKSPTKDYLQYSGSVVALQKGSGYSKGSGTIPATPSGLLNVKPAQAKWFSSNEPTKADQGNAFTLSVQSAFKNRHSSFPVPVLSTFIEKKQTLPAEPRALNLQNRNAAIMPVVVSTNEKKIPFKPKLYFGLSTGVELNQVKNQGMTKAGLNAGVLLGLQVRNRLAVETGVNFGKKRFYSSGEYFKPNKEDMPPDMKIMSLQSNCSMVEIPLAVKYDLSSRKDGWYAKAGISSLVMIKESNDYQTMVAGQEQLMTKTYNDKTGISAAQVILSAGYTKSLTPKTQMRFEPYVQIPVRGIGIGSMPVMSTGLHLIIKRK